MDVLVGKTLKAAEAFQAKEILVAGGVSANRALRQAFQAKSKAPGAHPTHRACAPTTPP